MGTVTIRRSVRRPAPAIPTGDLVVGPPPEIPRQVAGRRHQWLMALPMLGGTVAMAMMMGQGRAGPHSYVIGALFGISSLAMLMLSFSSATGPRRAETAAARRDYLRHLARLRVQVRRTAHRQRIGLLYRHPAPERLWSTVVSSRVWERRPTDSDFAVIRVGVGPQTLATPLIPPQTRPPDELDPMAAAAMRRFLDAYSIVPDLPVAMSLRSFPRVFVRCADPDGASGRALVRAVLVQLAVFHSPGDLLIAVCAGPERRAEWEWVKWLPHARHPTLGDALGPVRLVFGDGADLGSLPDDGQHLVVVRDAAGHVGERPGVTTVIDLDRSPPRAPDGAALVLEIGAGGELSSYTLNQEIQAGRADQISTREAEAVARRLAPMRPVSAPDLDGSSPISETGLAELLGITDPRNFTVNGDRMPRARLRVPIGVSDGGLPVELDLKEPAQDGMGPHGLVVGATGSGKSELLRTLVLALAVTHSPETLNFVLIDFKGGATFASMDRLPHTAALITNLEDALPLVDDLSALTAYQRGRWWTGGPPRATVS